MHDEEKAGLTRLRGYESFARQVKETKLALVDFLVAAAKQGKSVAGLRRAGEERDVVALLRDRERSDRIHRGPQSI